MALVYRSLESVLVRGLFGQCGRATDVVLLDIPALQLA